MTYDPPRASRDGEAAPHDLDSHLMRVVEEYLEGLEHGRPVRREDILAAHPDHAEALAESLAAVDALFGAATSSRAGGLDGLAPSCPRCGAPLPPLPPEGPAEWSCASCDLSLSELAPPTAPELPRALGRFELVELLGAGSFGVVYRARDPRLGREVAIKAPRAGTLASPGEAERFLREARSVARLHHPGIVAVHEIGEADGLPFIVSELVRGPTLRDSIAERRREPLEAAELVARIAEALEYAHERGFVHRDIKTSNILLADDGRPLITDFGLVRSTEAAVTVTVEGQVLGTPAYMSPEQARGELDRIGPRSDVYSLGVVLYELIAGERPFTGTRSRVMLQVLSEEPPSLRRSGARIPRDLDTVCMTAMAKEPERRYPSARAFGDDLRRVLRGQPIAARPISRAGRIWRWCRREPVLATTTFASALLLLSALVGFMLFQHAATARLEREVVEKQEALDRAEGRRLTVLSSLRLAEDPGQALLLALEAARQSPGILADDALRHALAALREEHTLLSHDGPTLDLAITPAGDKLITIGRDSSICRWDIATGALERRLLEDYYQTNSVACDPTGRRVVTTSWDRHARVWNLELGALERRLRHGGVVRRAVFLRDGTGVVTASADGIARIWDTASGKVLSRMRHEGEVADVDISADGHWITTASEDGTARIWSSDGRAAATLEGHSSWVTRSRFGPRGDRVATASQDGTARIWSLSGRLLHVLDGHLAGLRDVAWSPDGALLATASEDDTAALWSAETGERLAVLSGHEAAVSTVELSGDASVALTASDDRTLRLWSVANGRELVAMRGHQGPIHAARLTPDGDRVVSVSEDRTARVWRLPPDEVRNALARGRESRPRPVFSPGRDRYALVARGAVVEIRDSETDESTARLEGHRGRVFSVRFDSEGERLVTAGSDGTARIWDARSGALLRELRGHLAWVVSAEFDAAGERVVTASLDLTARVWDTRTGEPGVLRGALRHDDHLTGAFFSPDGGRIVTFSKDQTARIWSATTGRELLRLRHPRRVILHGAMSPDGRWLLTTTTDDELTLWNTIDGKRTAELDGGSSDVAAIAFDERSRRLAIAFADGNARVWAVPSGELLASVRSRASSFCDVGLLDSADGAALSTLSARGLEERWPLDPEATATARTPRELTADERDRLRVGDEEERLARRAEQKERRAQERLRLIESLLESRPTSHTLQWQLWRVLNDEDLLARNPRSLEVLERTLERDDAPHQDVLRWFAHASVTAGRPLAAISLLERPRGPDRLALDGLLADLRERVAPDVPTFASIDAALAGGRRRVLVDERSTWRVFRGTRSPSPGLEWTEADFDDGAWGELASPFGFGESSLRGTLDDMARNYTSIYARRSFEVASPSAWSEVTLSLVADDGCLLFLNGAELLGVRVGSSAPALPFDAVATGSPAEPVRTIRVTLPAARLRAGRNVIALHGLASSLRSRDVFFTAAVEVSSPPTADDSSALATRLRSRAHGVDDSRRVLYAKSRTAWLRGDAAEAARILESLLDERFDERLACRLVEALRASGRHAEGEAWLARLLDERSSAATERERRSLAGLPDHLVEERAMALNDAAWSLAVDSRADSLEHVTAYRWARRAVSARPLDRDANSTLALAALRVGRLESALSILDRIALGSSLRLEASPVEDLLCRALVLAALDRTEPAREALRAALERLEPSAGRDLEAPELLHEARARVPLDEDDRRSSAQR